MRPQCVNSSRRFTLGTQTPEPLLVLLLQDTNVLGAGFICTCMFHMSASAVIEDIDIYISHLSRPVLMENYVRWNNLAAL